MPNSSQEPWASSKAPNQDLNDMEVLCTFKTKIEPKFGSSVYQRPGTISKSRSRCQTPVRNLQCLPMPQIRTWRTWMFFAPSKSRWRAKVQIVDVSKISDHIQIIIKMLNPSQEHPASSKPKWGLKGHGCSFHLQNQDREPKFLIWVYQRPVTISKSMSGCQIPVRILQHPPKPQIRT